MAIWQYDIYLVPRTRLEDLYDEIPDHMGIEIFEEVEWWRGHRVTDEDKESIGRCLALNENALPGCLEWGTEDSNRISIGFEGEDVVWVWIRVDVRTKYDTFITCITDLAKNLDCLLLLKDEMILIRPELSNLSLKIRSSRASKLFMK